MQAILWSISSFAILLGGLILGQALISRRPGRAVLGFTLILSGFMGTALGARLRIDQVQTETRKEVLEHIVRTVIYVRGNEGCHVGAKSPFDKIEVSCSRVLVDPPATTPVVGTRLVPRPDLRNGGWFYETLPPIKEITEGPLSVR